MKAGGWCKGCKTSNLDNIKKLRSKNMKKVFWISVLVFVSVCTVAADTSITTYGNGEASIPVSLDLSSGSSVVTPMLKAGIRKADCTSISAAKTVAASTDFLDEHTLSTAGDSFTDESLYFFYFLQTADTGITINVKADENMTLEEGAGTIPWTVGIKGSGNGSGLVCSGGTVNTSYKEISDGTNSATFTHDSSTSIASFASYQLYLNVESDAYLEAPAGKYTGDITITISNVGA